MVSNADTPLIRNPNGVAPFVLHEISAPRQINCKYHPRKWPASLVIQCKWRASGGTTDEKYPFEVLSINADGYPAIIILDGEGYRRGAAMWLRGQAGRNYLKHGFNPGDFQQFVSRGQL